MLNFNSQMSLHDIHNKINISFESQSAYLIELLENNINFWDIIPDDFKSAFYKSNGRPHSYHLESYIRFFILQNILGIEKDSVLINILLLSNEIRYFCRFNEIPDPSQFFRFRKDYQNQIANMFESLVELTEPICRKIDAKKADYLIYDTSGLELPVKENNPKFFNSKLNETKKLVKDNPNFNPYAAVYGYLPDYAAANSDVKQQYINGHFCYALKFGILTNGLGIPRFIAFFYDDFKKLHPEIIVKKTDNPNIDKEIADTKSLKPVLDDFILVLILKPS